MTNWLPRLFARLPAGAYTKLLGFVTAWAEGRAMTLEQAIEFTLKEEQSDQ